MKLLVINGPNLNMLGIREPEVYGTGTLDELESMISDKCEDLGIVCDFYQSNHEGDLVDRIQEAYQDADGIIINAGGYTHTSVAILDALKAVGIPAVEVHISDINEREPFRKLSYVSYYAYYTIIGKGFGGYLEAVDILAAYNRVVFMERLMDRVSSALESCDKYEGMVGDIRTLEKYYENEWRSDYEMDEAGIFPKGLKRGVLSEDGLYDLLNDFKER